MAVTKTNSNTYNLKVYIPKEIRSKMGIKGNHFVKRYKTRKEAKEAELEILTKIQIKFKFVMKKHFLKTVKFYSLSSLIIFGGIHTKLVKQLQQLSLQLKLLLIILKLFLESISYQCSAIIQSIF